MTRKTVSRWLIAGLFTAPMALAAPPTTGVAPSPNIGVVPGRAGVVPVTIGVAMAAGTFKLNSADVEGNANIFDGAQLRTGKSPSQVVLQNGASVTLGTNSAGTIYRDRFVLEEGMTRVDNMAGYTVQAAMYRIQADQAATRALVRVAGDDIDIAALSGSLAVSNDKGMLLTHVGAGTASAFNRNPQTEQSSGPPVNYENRRKEAILYSLLLISMAGFGLAVDAILQPGAAQPLSP